MSKAIHTCLRCGIPVAEDKLELPDRCVDPDCPLNDLGRELKAKQAARPTQSKLEGIWNGG